MEENKNKKTSKRNKKLLSILIVVVIISLTFQLIEKNKNEILFKDFSEMLSKERIEEVTLNLGNDSFEFKTTDGKTMKTENPRYDGFKKDLLDKGIPVNEKSSSRLPSLLLNLFISLIPMGILLYFLMPMLKSQMSSIGTNQSKKIAEIPKVTFDKIAGNEESKLEMMNLVNFLKKPKEYALMGAKLPKGVILYGPPGTGKTLTARAIAGEAGVPFFNVSGSDFIEMFAGLGAKRVRDLFKEAKENSPCIIFIDEIDAIGSTRTEGVGNQEQNQTINALLSEMDGFEENDSVIVVAATNRVEFLDNALTRPGRFDRHIAIDLPDKEDRIKILENYTKTKELALDVNIKELAELTIGFSGAGLESLINEAAIHAVNRNVDKIYYEDIDESFYKIIMKGNKKVNRERDKKEVELVAYHEAGHALCAKLLTDNSIPKVTIIPSTSGAGGVTFNIPKKQSLLTKKEILNNIKVLYAGRASEYILRGSYDDVTTGASHDIKQATEYIKAYFTQYGMSDKYGLLDMTSLIKDGDITEESIELSKKLYNETLSILENNKNKLVTIAELLIEQETITEKELDNIIG